MCCIELWRGLNSKDILEEILCICCYHEKYLKCQKDFFHSQEVLQLCSKLPNFVSKLVLNKIEPYIGEVIDPSVEISMVRMIPDAVEMSCP